MPIQCWCTNHTILMDTSALTVPTCSAVRKVQSAWRRSTCLASQMLQTKRQQKRQWVLVNSVINRHRPWRPKNSTKKKTSKHAAGRSSYLNIDRSWGLGFWGLFSSMSALHHCLIKSVGQNASVGAWNQYSSEGWKKCTCAHCALQGNSLLVSCRRG